MTVKMSRKDKIRAGIISEEEKRLRIKFMMLKMTHSDSIDARFEHALMEMMPALEDDTLKRIGYIVRNELERRKIPWYERQHR